MKWRMVGGVLQQQNQPGVFISQISVMSGNRGVLPRDPGRAVPPRCSPRTFQAARRHPAPPRPAITPAAGWARRRRRRRRSPYRARAEYRETGRGGARSPSENHGRPPAGDAPAI